MNQTNWQKRRDVLICIICTGIIIWAAWGLLGQFVTPILLLLLSMTVAFLISPLVNYMQKRGIPRALGTIAVFLVILAVLFGFGYALVSSLVNQVAQFSNTVTKFVDGIPNTFASVVDFLEHQGGIPKTNVDDTIKQLTTQVSAFAQAAVTSTPLFLIGFTNTLLDFLIIMVLSFYFTLDGKRIRDSIISILPERSRPQGLLFEDALNRVVGNYIRGQLTLAFIIGALTALVCVITGLGQFALIFGVLGFLFETIPMVGPGLAMLAPILVSLLLPGAFPRTLIIIGCFAVIQILESNILGPRIVGHAVGLHPVASIMALLVFAQLFGSAFGAFGGAIGALIATPLVAAVWVVVSSAYRSIRGESADQILARKRAPWNLRRPSMPSSLRFGRADNQREPHSGDEGTYEAAISEPALAGEVAEPADSKRRPSITGKRPGYTYPMRDEQAEGQPEDAPR